LSELEVLGQKCFNNQTKAIRDRFEFPSPLAQFFFAFWSKGKKKKYLKLQRRERAALSCPGRSFGRIYFAGVHASSFVRGHALFSMAKVLVYATKPPSPGARTVSA